MELDRPREPAGAAPRTWALTGWFALGAVGYVLLLAQGWGDRGPIWFLEPTIYATLFAGVWLRRTRGVPVLPPHAPRQAARRYVAITWVTALLLESRVVLTGGGTVWHLLTVQGFYWPFIFALLFLLRRYGYTLPELYYGGIAASFTESMLFGNALTATLASPLFFLSPILLGYFGLVYGTISSIALVFVDERSLWSRSPKPVGLLRKLLYCFLATGASYLVFAIWGTLIGTLLPA